MDSPCEQDSTRENAARFVGRDLLDKLSILNWESQPFTRTKNMIIHIAKITSGNSAASLVVLKYLLRH